MLDRLGWLFQPLFPRLRRRKRPDGGGEQRPTREEIEERRRKQKQLELERLKQEGQVYFT